jgi:hypothetical protein
MTFMRFAPILAPILALALLGACARLPAEEARGTPAESVAAQGFASLSVTGVPLGSAVAIAPDRLLTNAHVVPPGNESLGFRRGDGAVGGTATLLARSDRMDLAVLAIPTGLMRPVALAEPRPAPASRSGRWARPRRGRR